MANGKAPLKRTYTGTIPALAANASGKFAFALIRFKGRIVSAQYAPSAGMVGQATNNRVLEVTRTRPAATTPSAMLVLDNGVSISPANTKGDLTLAATESWRDVEPGDILRFDSTHVGTGIVDPGGLVIVEVERYPDAD